MRTSANGIMLFVAPIFCDTAIYSTLTAAAICASAQTFSQDMNRTVFYISDSTGITAEMIGRSLLSRFDGLDLAEETVSFVDSKEKARDVAAKIAASGDRPLVFCTLVDPEIVGVFRRTGCFLVDCFEIHLKLLEKELGLQATTVTGRSHSIQDLGDYSRRMEALNFTMAHDDGLNPGRLDDADVILVGISRCGKTPTCMYLALHFGMFAANYPLTPDDLGKGGLPAPLIERRGKLYALTIRPERLSQIRSVRRPESVYAELETCRREVRQAEALIEEADLPCLDVTSRSIEELAAKIRQETGHSSS